MSAEPSRSRLELVDEPGDCPAAMGGPGAAAVRQPDRPSATSARRRVRSAISKTSLSFFRNHYDKFAPTARRSSGCTGWSTQTHEGRALPAVLVKPSEDGAVELAHVEVRTPAGDQLIDPLDVQLETGRSLVITGQSGAGKTTLLRSLAELWPYATGTLCRPEGDNATMFLSQLPYVPLGTLRGVVCYPNSPDDVAGRHAAATR